MKTREYRPISSLRNWEKNPRTIDKNGLERLKAQLNRIKELTGEYLYKPLLITPDNIVIGGNMRLRALKELGEVQVWVNVVNVKNEQEMLEVALSDNDQAGKTEKDLLLELIEQYPEIKLSDYAVNFDTPTTLEDFMSQFKEVEEDEVPEVDEQGEPESKLGEVYQLGRHRLMCGDATKIEDVEKLMNGQKADMVFTDPPYGMDLDTEYIKNDIVKGNSYDKVIGDDKDFDYQQYAWIDCKEQFWWGADYYAKTLPNKGSWFVWDKKKEGLDESIGSGFEICWSKTPHKKEMIRILWSGFTAKERNETRTHPTQKPIQLCVWFINKYSQPEQKVLDLFGGSGSTLIACEQTNRTCYMMELDPKYCDVIRKRYENFTKK